jgi:hypothetical protein
MVMQVADYRTKDSFRFSCEISKPSGKLDHILEWCKHELRDEWRWDLIDVSTDIGPGRYHFYFDNERDYFVFTLYWK